jgi:hypothetical protein
MNIKAELKQLKAELNDLETQEPKIAQLLEHHNAIADEARKAGRNDMGKLEEAAAAEAKCRDEIYALRERVAVLQSEADDQDAYAVVKEQTLRFDRLTRKQRELVADVDKYLAEATARFNAYGRAAFEARQTARAAAGKIAVKLVPGSKPEGPIFGNEPWKKAVQLEMDEVAARAVAGLDVQPMREWVSQWEWPGSTSMKGEWFFASQVDGRDVKPADLPEEELA